MQALPPAARTATTRRARTLQARPCKLRAASISLHARSLRAAHTRCRGTPTARTRSTSKQNLTMGKDKKQRRAAASAAKQKGLEEKKAIAVAMQSLFGPVLKTKKGNEPTADVLRGARAVGIYFAASWSAHACAFTKYLSDRYQQCYKAKHMEIVYVSSDRDEESFDAHFASDMPWVALPYAERERKIQLASKYRVSGLPSLVVVDGKDAHTISADAREDVARDPTGERFPWQPLGKAEVAAMHLSVLGPEIVARAASRHILLYFAASAHPQCARFTPVLKDMYEGGLNEKAEVVFISFDREEADYNEFSADMPWAVLPHGDKDTMRTLTRTCEVRGIPSLVLLDPQGNIVTNNGIQKVIGDPLGESIAGGGWAQQPCSDVNDYPDDLNKFPCLIALGSDAAMTAAVEKVAQQKWQEAGEDTSAMPMRFYTGPDGPVVEQLRSMLDMSTGNQLVLVDFPGGGKFYVCGASKGGESIFASFGEAAINAFLSGVKDGSVESRQIERAGDCEDDCDPNSFSACCAPRPGQRPPPEFKAEDLRFKVGDKVECNTGEPTWAKGTIIALMYRDTMSGGVAPYQIKLDDGTLIFAPMDDERVVRAAK